MFSSTPSMSSSASAFGSPLSFGPPIGYPSPFSTPATSSSPFTTGYNPFSQTSYTKTTEFDDRGEGKMPVSISAMPAYSDKSHEELRWEDHHQFNAAGGGVVPAFARNRSTGLSRIFPSVPSSPFATTVTTPSIGQSPFLNPVPLSDPTVYRGPVPPSVPSSPFAMNHVKPNLESVLDKMEEWEKSTQLICKVVKHFQEDTKSWIERVRSVELEKIEATQTINQLREELAHVTRSKEAIIAEYLASPAFTKRLDEEREKMLSKIFHPCYVKALGEVQTKFPEINPFTFQRPATGWFPPSPSTFFSGHNPYSPFTFQRPATGWFPPSPSTLFTGHNPLLRAVDEGVQGAQPPIIYGLAQGLQNHWDGPAPTPATLDPCYARKEQENKKTSI